MSEQLDILFAAVPDGAYDGAEQAEANTPSGFKELIRTEIEALARSGMEWTTDDLRRRIDEEPEQPNQIGAAVMAASKAGIIVAVGARPSTWPTTHGRLIRVWRGARPAA